MNAKEFVQGVLFNLHSSIRSAIEFIQNPPPGRKPLWNHLEMHRWYDGLVDSDKEMVQKLIKDTYQTAVYSFLMVLDHKMFFEGYGEKGELQLYYRSPEGEVVHLNPLGGEDGKDLEYYFKISLNDLDNESSVSDQRN
jgi:hypothetical protein